VYESHSGPEILARVDEFFSTRLRRDVACNVSD
jgi:hypothetical protein